VKDVGPDQVVAGPAAAVLKTRVLRD